MISAVRLAAMMPASRAVWRGSPFFTAPGRIAGAPRATSRSARGRRLPGRSPACADVHHPHPAALVHVRTGARLPAFCRPFAARLTLPSPPRRKNDRLSSDTVRSTFLSFTPGGTLSAPGREVQDRADARGDDAFDDALRRVSGHGDDGDVMLSRLTIFRNSPMSWIRTPPLDRRPIFSRSFEECDDREAFLAEPRVVRERETQLPAPRIATRTAVEPRICRRCGAAP